MVRIRCLSQHRANKPKYLKNYIRKFALEIGGVELKGKDSITLSNGAEFHFMSTNVFSSQGFNGHMYYDEVFWIPNFKKLDDYAGGMSISGSIPNHVFIHALQARRTKPIQNGQGLKKAILISVIRRLKMARWAVMVFSVK